MLRSATLFGGKMRKRKRPNAEFTVTLKDVATAWGVSRKTVDRKRAKRLIEGRQIGVGAKQRWKFHPADVESLAKMYGRGG